MIKYLNKEKGSALVTVIMVMAVLMVLGVGILNVGVAENRFAKINEDSLQAHYIARSGAQAIAEYMIQDAHGDAADFIGETSDWNNQIGGGRFQITVEEDNANNVVNIISTGELNGREETVKIRVTRSSDGIGGIFQHAIVAKNDITVDGNGNKTEIEGSVASKDGTIVLDKATTTEGIVYDPDLLFPAIILPPDRDPAISYDHILGNISVNGGTAPTISSNSSAAKYVHAGNITIKNNEFRVTGDGVVHMFVEGDINLDTNARFAVASTAKLYIYVVGNRTLYLKGNGAQNNIFIYAPDSEVIWNNAQPNNDFYGAIIADSVTLFNQLTIRHNPDMVDDVDLDTSGAGVTFTGYKWID